MPAKTPSQKFKIGVGYIRESTEEQDKGFSPDNQKRMIEEYAKKNNIQIVDWYKDLISGTKASKRDDFQRMITDAQLRKFEVILIYHTSRFARNVADARQYKDLLRKKLGIDVLSVTQNFGSNYNDPSQFLNEGVNELFDEHYSKQLSFWVRNSLMEKRRQGKQNGNPPLGYYKKKIGFDKEKNRPIYDKTWLVQPEEAKLVKKIFTHYATNKYSLADLAAEVNTWGVKTKIGNPFTYSSLKGLLCNKTYLGMVFSWRRGYPTEKGLHPAILPHKLFDKVQEVLHDRRNTMGRPVAQHRFYLLQGLVYCYRCINYLKGKENNPNARMLPNMYCETHQWVYPKHTGTRQERLMYGCKIKRENKSCSQKDVEAKIIDDQVIDLMEAFRLPPDVIEMTLDKLKGLFKQASKSSKDINVVKTLEARKKRLNFQWENTEELEELEYLTKLKEINDGLKKYESLGLVNGSGKNKEAEYLKKTEKFLKEFKNFWRSDIGNQERREWLQMILKRVWVKDEDVVAIEPHDDFKPLFVSHRKVIVQGELNPYIRFHRAA
ncbi:MAG: recombinase family protein [Patescibacteria group bacterium]|nr:recombinase family protein [Patescibacteria group bacterium]